MIKFKTLFTILIIITAQGLLFSAQINILSTLSIHHNVIFEEKNGLVAVKAEFFYKQTLNDVRQCYITSKNELAKVGYDNNEQSMFQIFVNNDEIETYAVPLTKNMFKEGKTLIY